MSSDVSESFNTFLRNGCEEDSIFENPMTFSLHCSHSFNIAIQLFSKDTMALNSRYIYCKHVFMLKNAYPSTGGQVRKLFGYF